MLGAARCCSVLLGAARCCSVLLGSFALGLVLFMLVPTGAMSGAFAVLCAVLIGVGAFTMTVG
ncbi:hypothetical protein, partial [Burkholderia sp. Ac-20384]|uniref:hypothetical protein n=1 Tax=Burkholderia sp. Ac-20384 TaxID=2703902 RepID=UPI003216295A